MTRSSVSTIRPQLQPLLQRMANRIEAAWKRHLDLSPYHLPDDLGYIEGKLEGDRLVIENKCYQTPQFRKLHLELAKIGQSLDVLHCVMFPRPEYDLPMFGADLVGGRGQVSMAIADLSPINASRTLPPAYVESLRALPTVAFLQPRRFPEWGDIFSEFCLFIRPQSEDEEAQFLDRVEAFLEIHCQRAIATSPTPERRDEFLAGQSTYCTRQQENDKTRRVLEKAFGTDWADRYMNLVLFDLAKP